MVACDNGAADAGANGWSALAHPVLACPAELHGHEGLGTEPDGVDKVDDIRLEILDGAEEFGSEKVELQV